MIHARTFQVLACEISIATDCPEIADRLDYVTVRAAQSYPVSRRVAYRVERDADRYLVRENGEPWYRDGSADRVVIAVFRQMHARVYGQMRGSLRLHAGCGRDGDRLFLVAGAKGAGKSTLMTALLFEGFDILGDERVLGVGRDVTALPRRFHLKPPALRLLPRVAALADHLPFVLGDDGQRIVAFDPTDAGLPWTIRTGRPAAIFFLRPNHGGATTLRPCPKLAMIRCLMPESAMDGGGAGTWIRGLGALVREAHCYTLHLGDLSAATRLLRRALDETGTGRESSGRERGIEAWNTTNMKVS